MLNYKDNKCNRQLYIFHKAICEFFKREEDKRIINDHKTKSYVSGFANITKNEIKCLKNLRVVYETDVNGHSQLEDIPVPSLLPTLSFCPYLTMTVLTIMNDLDDTQIDITEGLSK